MFNTYTIEQKECDVFAAMERITPEDVQSFMKTFSSGKVKKPQIGYLSIVNRFIPEVKENIEKLLSYEGSYVFYATERFSTGLFSKAQVRTFIWAPLSDTLFAVPPQSVSFEKPLYGAKQEIFILQTGEEHPHHTEKYDGKEHICSFEKMELYREFAIDEKEINATKDIVRHYFRWSDPDSWVSEHFKIEKSSSAMFYLRNELKEIPWYSVRASYPSRPYRQGGEIDE